MNYDGTECRKKKKDYKKGYILPVCIFILMMVMLFYGVNSVTNATAQKEQESLKNAVVQSAVHCYSVEGAYPDSLDYLKKTVMESHGMKASIK
mgnify:CR=1 FL=1